MYALPRRLVGADDLEVLVDEDVVRPVDADVVGLVLAVAQLHNTVDDAPRVGGQCSFRRLIRCRSGDDRPRPFGVVRRDLTDLLCGGRGPAVGWTMTCVAVMLVPLTVPSTRTGWPVVMALAEVKFVPFWYVVVDASLTV